jgi:hypothetical protein
MSTKKLPSAPDAHNITELRKKLADAESDARSAKNALKSAKQRAKDSKRELKKARKALKRATETKVEASKTGAAPKPRSKEAAATKAKSKASRKKQTKPSPKNPSKESKTRELGLRVANSPETRRRARVKKSRPISISESTPAAPSPATEEGSKE